MVVGALGTHEVRTGERAFPRPGGARNASVRRDPWFLVGLGIALVLLGLIELLGLPEWWLLVGLLLAVGAAVAGLMTYRPRNSPGRRVDPPSDPDDVWRRDPPGY